MILPSVASIKRTPFPKGREYTKEAATGMGTPKVSRQSYPHLGSLE